MLSKLSKNSFKEIASFFLNNIFVVAIVVIVLAKVLYFNKTFGFLDNGNVVFIVPVVVITILTFLLFLPIIFKDKNKFRWALILDIALTILIYTDIIYMRYFNAMPSVQSIFYADAAFGVTSVIANLFKVKDLLLTLDIPILILVYRWSRRKMPLPKQNKDKKIAYIFSFLLISSFLFAFAYDFKNVRLLTTRVYDNKVIAERYGIEAYHLIDLYNFARYRFQFISTAKKEEIVNKAKKYIKNEMPNSKTNIGEGKNIILLQVESLQNSVINQRIEGQEITPNINQLVKNSDYFTNHYYELGFGGTADTDFTVNTSFFPMKNAASFVQYGKDNYNGLAGILAQNGYSTSAYHAFNRSFWNRNVALKSLGYQRFLAAESYQNGQKIQMGLGDYDFLTQTIQKIKKEKAPNLSYIITLTSHHPFELPNDKRNLKLNANYPENILNYYQAIHYTDKAIGNFIDELKRNNLFDKSIIILYGDHSLSLGDLSSGEVIKALGENGNITDLKERTELKRIPLIIHFPGQTKEVVHKDVSSHIDIMPTILNIAGLKPKIPMFGRDLYGNQAPYFASVLYFDSGIIVSRDKVYANGVIAGLENGKCYLIQSNRWRQIAVNNCASLVQKRDQEIEVSTDLIKYNLFNQIK